MTVGSWECTIIKLGDAAYHDILASAGLELTLFLLSSGLSINGFLDSSEGIRVAEMCVCVKEHVETVVFAFASSALRIFRFLAPFPRDLDFYPPALTSFD
ncbi:unnamed protein product [Ectocarpus sp. CCAP 1310/34]|nr:unnamed protein product [Ectocarpus sp. CCAP 1310/34]